MRRNLLDAGRAILNEEKLQAGSTNVTSKRVFDRLETETGQRITDASAIGRIWENQADCLSDVLMEPAQVSTRPEAVIAIDPIEAELRSLDLTTLGSRNYAIQHVCRTGGNASTLAIANSETWQLWISVTAMAFGSTSLEQQEKVQSALAIGYGDVTTFWSDGFAVLIDVVGHQLRPPFTMGEFVLAAIAHSEGCAPRQKSASTIDVAIRPTGPNGEDQEWTLSAIGLEGLARRFLEADPAQSS
jgi:hypothetical protein